MIGHLIKYLAWRQPIQLPFRLEQRLLKFLTTRFIGQILNLEFLFAVYFLKDANALRVVDSSDDVTGEINHLFEIVD